MAVKQLFRPHCLLNNYEYRKEIQIFLLFRTNSRGNWCLVKNWCNLQLYSMLYKQILLNMARESKVQK